MNRLTITAILAAAPLATPTLAQQDELGPSTSVLRYDASLGTLPTDQGWALTGTLDGDDQVIDGVFHLNVAGGPVVFFQSYAVDFDWGEGVTLSMRVRVPEGTVAGDGFRGGATLFGNDLSGHQYGVLVGSDALVFSSHTNMEHDPVLTVEFPFDAATEFHTYSIVSFSDRAELRIDGVPRAVVPAGDQDASIGESYVQWSANSVLFDVQSEWTDVVLFDDSPILEDLNSDGCVDTADLGILLAAFGQCR
ncbi:MAG: hypothetical protein H6813_07070 [Phycisphaeraceae bacterium]|nr:hypothetical protein [Phycisphaeraceae bacterium]MCB9848697.1 hypothetical protein [Phycisphaeraceae bacterium]